MVFYLLTSYLHAFLFYPDFGLCKGFSNLRILWQHSLFPSKYIWFLKLCKYHLLQAPYVHTNPYWEWLSVPDHRFLLKLGNGLSIQKDWSSHFTSFFERQLPFHVSMYCRDQNKSIHLLNQHLFFQPYEHFLRRLPSTCSPRPISLNSSDLSGLQMETWKVGVFRCINPLNIHIPGVNQPYSEHWQRLSQELLLLLDVVSSLLSHRDFLGLLGNQSGLPASSLKTNHVKVSMNAGILYRWKMSAISAISTAKLLHLWKAETRAQVQMDNTDCEAVWRWKICLRNGELAWLKGKRCFENLPCLP